ncbi:MAG TPA: ABC transporter substrate-binding protein [Clostridia bacterium]|nr:ABC transporter substrate-binding protein [Clostridia bacterium]
MSEKIKISLACEDYDRTRALRDGLVSVEGVELEYVSLGPLELFKRVLQNEEFDAAELSFSNYMMERSRDINRFIALPVFTSRMFRHSSIFVNTQAGIEKPQDLAGKKVGVLEYHITAALCIRGFLSDDYGVRPETIRWFTGGQEKPEATDRMAHIKLPESLSIQHIGPHQTLNKMLEEGELDALITAFNPTCFIKKSPHVRRLFPDFRKEEEDYYLRTGIFPIMHLVVIRQKVYEQNPYLAESLYRAFAQAKDLAQEKLRKTSALTVLLPWLIPEIEQVENMMGPDYWAYGVSRNRRTLDAEARWSFEQGLSPRLLDVEELFAPNTLAL